MKKILMISLFLISVFITACTASQGCGKCCGDHKKCESCESCKKEKGGCLGRPAGESCAKDKDACTCGKN